MPQQRSYRLTLDLSEAELRAFKNVLDHPFCGDDDDLAGIVGGHHLQIKTAKRMREKVYAVIERTTTARADAYDPRSDHPLDLDHGPSTPRHASQR